MAIEPHTTGTPNIKKRGRRRRLSLAVICWLYLLAIIAFLCILRGAGDRQWRATLLLFGPRWIALLPMAILAPLAAAISRRYLWILAVGALLVIGPMMGLRMHLRSAPWRQIPLDHQDYAVRILTLNSHYWSVDINRLAKLIRDTKPDVVALQECGPLEGQLPVDESEWHVYKWGNSYLASRFPARRAMENDTGFVAAESGAYLYEIQTPRGIIHFFNVHFASPHLAFRAAINGAPGRQASVERNSEIRRNEAENLSDKAAVLGSGVFLVGDFNLTTDSTIFRSSLSRFRDAFTEAGFGFGLTYCGNWTTTRIDHVLMSDGWNCVRCWLGPDVGSPHRPLFVDVQMIRH